MTSLALTSFYVTHRGGRPYNEDACDREILTNSHFCWVLADGLGGHGGGDVASKIAVEAALESFRMNSSVSELDVKRHVFEADQAVRSRKAIEPELSNMHTTLVILVSDRNDALWAHVGDSRLYHFRNGRCVFRTHDHSVPQIMADAGDIPEKAIRSHEDRNRLLRSIGDAEPARAEVAERVCTLVSGDAFLLCSDGFWEYVLETEMEVDLSKARGPDDWLQTMVVDRVLKRAPPECDNLTAVSVFVSNR